MPTLVSIVTPVYNGAKYIADTLQSVLGQTYPNVEHIVLDDGSTDDTPKILQQYAERYPNRIRVYQHDNMGQAQTVNRGFTLVRGDVIGWINADDLYMPWAVEEAVAMIEEDTSRKVVYAGVEYIDENGKPYKSLAEWADLSFDLVSLIFFDWLPISHSSLFLQREVLFRVGLLDPHLFYALDVDWIFRIALLYDFAVKPNRVWSQHRRHPEAKTHNLAAKYRSALDFPYIYAKLAHLPDLPITLYKRRDQIVARGYWHAAIRMKPGGHKWLAVKYLFLSLLNDPFTKSTGRMKTLAKYLIR